MDLLNNKQLEQSSVVANSSMNRDRKAVGVNSYERELRLDPIKFLQQRVNQTNTTRWLDLCCGSANALIETAEHFYRSKMSEPVFITGVDLVGMFSPVPKHLNNISLIKASIVDWESDHKFDLITCVHGLHYLGDKLAAIEKLISYLKPEGLFIGHLDLNNIKNDTGESWKTPIRKILRATEIQYDNEKKILSTIGNRPIKFGFNYLGASDTAGPNFTGQDVVDSYYQNH